MTSDKRIFFTILLPLEIFVVKLCGLKMPDSYRCITKIQYNCVNT